MMKASLAEKKSESRKKIDIPFFVFNQHGAIHMSLELYLNFTINILILKAKLYHYTSVTLYIYFLFHLYTSIPLVFMAIIVHKPLSCM